MIDACPLIEYLLYSFKDINISASIPTANKVATTNIDKATRIDFILSLVIIL